MKITLTGRPADAAAELIVRSTLGDAIADRRGRIYLDGNAYVIAIPDPHPADDCRSLHPDKACPDPMATLSTGERMLWNTLLSIAGLTDQWSEFTSLYAMCDRLDERSMAAVHAAVGVLFGVTAEAAAR